MLVKKGVEVRSGGLGAYVQNGTNEELHEVDPEDGEWVSKCHTVRIYRHIPVEDGLWPQGLGGESGLSHWVRVVGGGERENGRACPATCTRRRARAIQSFLSLWNGGGFAQRLGWMRNVRMVCGINTRNQASANSCS